MDKKDTYKAILTKMANFNEKISKIKEAIASLANDEQGGNVELTDEQKAEAAEKAKLEAEAAAAALKEQEEAKAKLEADEKAKAEAEMIAKAEADKKAVEEAAAKELADAAAKEKELADAAAAKALEEAEAAKKAKEEKVSKYKTAMSSDLVADLGLENAEAELATKYSFVELIKVLATLSKEVVTLKEEKAKAEASKIADSRYRELIDLGVAFIGKKGEAQKVKLQEMDEKAFASYKEMALNMKEAQDNGEGLTPEAIAKAKASLGNLSIEVNLNSESLADKYKRL
jgi:hypothetical protein